MTRVQIHALVSGDVSGPSLGPELAQRLDRLCAASGKRLHSLEVEVVQMPVRCPGCGDRALCRCLRRGFLQQRVFPLLGLYPWKCTSCRRAFVLRLRRPPAAVAFCPEEEARPKAA